MLYFVDVLLKAEVLIFQKFIFFVIFILCFLAKRDWKVYVVLFTIIIKIFEETKELIYATDIRPNFRFFFERLGFRLAHLISVVCKIIEFINIYLFNFLLLVSNKIERV